MRTVLLPACIGAVWLTLLTACGSSKSVVTGDFTALEDNGDGITAEIAYHIRVQDSFERIVLGSGVVENGSLELKFKFDEEVPRFGTFAMTAPDQSFTTGQGILLEQGSEYTIEVRDPANYWFSITSNGKYAQVYYDYFRDDEQIWKLRKELRELQDQMQTTDENELNEPNTSRPSQDSEANRNELREPSRHAEVLAWENMTCIDYAGEFETLWEKIVVQSEPFAGPRRVQELRQQLDEAFERRMKKTTQRFLEILKSSSDPIERLLVLEQRVDIELEDAVVYLEELETQLPEHVVEERVKRLLSWSRREISRRQVDDSLKLGSHAPTFELTLIDDKQVPFASVLQENQVVLLEFWENYCGSCIEALTEYQKFYADFAERGFEVVSLSIEQERDDWIQKSEELELPWINAFSLGGRDGKVAQMFGIDWPRKNFVVDSEGCILKRDLTPDELRDFLGARLGS